jgi:uncharacterized membrane protein YqjE
MAMRERDVGHGWQKAWPGPREEPSLGELFRQFGQDGVTLVRQEVALAKVELKQTLSGYARDAGRLGVAVALAWFGASALIAALIIGTGALLQNYWLSALLVAVLLLAAAAVLGRGALLQMKATSLKPEDVVETLEEDRRWAKREMQDLKRQLRR